MRNLTITGVTLQRGFLEWATVRPGKNSIEAINAGQTPCGIELLPETPAAALAAELNPALASVKGLVAIGIPSDQLLMRVMTLPTLDLTEMAGMVQLQMDKISPFPEDKMAVTFEKLFQDTDSTTVLIGAIRREIVDLYGAAFQSVGLTADRLDLNPLVWWKLLSRAGDLFGAGLRMAIVPDGVGGLVIAAGSGRPLAFRALASGAGLAADEYAEELVEDISSLLLSLEMEHGDTRLAGVDFWAKDEVDLALIGRLEEALHCSVQSRSTGAFAGVAVGLGERALVDFDPAQSDSATRRITADLVPLPWRQVRAARRMRRQLLFATGAIALFLIVLVGLFLGLLHLRRRGARDFEVSVAALEKEAADVKDLRARVTGLELHLDRSRSALECLREVTSAMPPGISLVSLQYRKGGSVIVRGETMTVSLIYDFKDAMDKSRLFKGVTLGQIQPSQRQHATVQVF